MSRRKFLKQITAVLGVSLSSAVSSAVLSSSNIHSAPAKSKLTAELKSAVSVLAEAIIPRTETPGAVDAKVPEFIDLIVSQWYSEQERNSFIVGLNNMLKFSYVTFSKSITCLNENQMTLLLSHYEKLHEQGGSQPEQEIFFRLKELTVTGFFTSEVGATQSLQHNHMAGKFIGDFPVKNVKASWSPIY